MGSKTKKYIDRMALPKVFRNRKCITMFLIFSFYLMLCIVVWEQVEPIFHNHLSEAMNNNKWISLSDNVSIFSAYCDKRKFRSQPVLVILGLERQRNPLQRYKCVMIYKNGTSRLLKDRSKLHVLTKVHWLGEFGGTGDRVANFRPFSYTCNLPPGVIPLRVSLIPENTAVAYTEYVEMTEKFAYVYQSTVKSSVAFGVCISSPIFKVTTPQQLIDCFEMNILLGADYFTVYIFAKIPPEYRRILDRYVENGKADVVYTWGENFPGQSHYYGQLLSVTDCLYRNINRVKYLVYTDLDEVIMPLRHMNWYSMIQTLDDDNVGAFIFNMVYLHQLIPSWNETIFCTPKRTVQLQSPRYATFRNRSTATLFTPKSKTKYILKTEFSIIAQIHYVEKLVDGFLKLKVPVEIGLVYHYRVPYMTSRKITSWFSDNIIKERHLSRLLASIENVLCELY